jgi:AGZA family xanthine/uracil permease-like MFS transporter
VVAGLFLLTLPLLPLVAAVPSIATAPALLVVGALIFAGAADIRWRDPVVAIPALATILGMPATFNISTGLGIGFVLWVVTHLAARRAREVKPLVYVIAAAFVAFFALKVGG